MVEGVKGREGKWFWGRVEHTLGDGMTTSFWNGLWAGEKSLKERFSRIFYLSNKHDEKVGLMGQWVDGRWEWKIEWRREL